MTRYVALLSTKKLKVDSDLLRDNLRNNVKAPQNALCQEVAIEFLDVILQRFMYDMLDELEMSAFQQSLLKNLANVVKKTTHTLIRQILKKKKNSELRNLVEYIEERELILEQDGEEVYYVCFPLDQDTQQKLDHAYAAIRDNRGHEVKAEYQQALQQFIDLTLDYFMEQPITLMKVGKIMQAVVNVAFSTIRKAQQMALDKSIPDLTNQEMIDYVDHMDKLFLDLEA